VKRTFAWLQQYPSAGPSYRSTLAAKPSALLKPRRRRGAACAAGCEEPQFAGPLDQLVPGRRAWAANADAAAQDRVICMHPRLDGPTTKPPKPGLMAY